VGEKIKTNKFFTINVLSTSQDEIAQTYSAARLPENVSDSNWVIQDTFAEISKCKIIMNCKLLQIYDDHAASIFVSKVIKHSVDQSQLTLIYNARRYGRFKSN
jgi:flavin reductase (DIM6/NTAB) family NADH-FMN oxidoreductase RutF